MYGFSAQNKVSAHVEMNMLCPHRGAFVKYRLTVFRGFVVTSSILSRFNFYRNSGLGIALIVDTLLIDMSF